MGATKYTPGFIRPITDEEILQLPGHGFNSVRLLTFWNAIAPEGPGTVDEAYMTAYATLLDKLTDAGLYVIVDMHQDLWGPPFEIHGAPEWTCPQELKDGYVPEEPWWVNYLAPQVMACFDLFWESEELQNQYAAMWANVAKAVCHNPKVVGFDLMNEPFAGSRITDPGFEAVFLFGMYARVLQAIEAVCPGRLYFIEASWSSSAVKYHPMPVPDSWMDRVVFSPHYYRPELHEPGGAGYTLPRDSLFLALDHLFRDYIQGGFALWMGEFGGFPFLPGYETYLHHMHQWFEARGAGSAIYTWGKAEGGFSLLDAQGHLKSPFHSVYHTPFPTLLPTGSTMASDYDQGSCNATFHCLPGLEIQWLLPLADECYCIAGPPGILTRRPGTGPITLFDCQQEGSVGQACRCAPEHGD